MASDLSTWFGNKIIRWMAGNALPAHSSLDFALYDGDPKAGGVDVSADINAFGRLPITFNVPASGVVNTMANNAAIDFGANQSVSSVDVSHIAIFTDNGDRIASDVIPGGPYTFAPGDPVKFNAGAIVFAVGA